MKRASEENIKFAGKGTDQKKTRQNFVKYTSALHRVKLEKNRWKKEKQQPYDMGRCKQEPELNKKSEMNSWFKLSTTW